MLKFEFLPLQSWLLINKVLRKFNCFALEYALSLELVSKELPKSLGGHFACLCQGFEFYEGKKNCYYFSKRKWKYFYTFYHFYIEKSSKRAK